MKKTVFLLALIMIFGSCSSGPKYFSESLKDMGLKGKVMTISINTDIDKDVDEEDLSLYVLLLSETSSTSYDFDLDGKLTEKKHYDKEGNVSSVIRYIYGDNSRLQEESRIEKENGEDFETQHTWYSYEDGLLKEKYWGVRSEYTRPEYYSITYEYENGKLKKEIEQRGVTSGDMTTMYSYPDDCITIMNSVYPCVSNPFAAFMDDFSWDGTPKAHRKLIKTLDKSGRVVSYKMEYSDEISKKTPEISLVQFVYNKKGDCVESVGGYLDSTRDYHFAKGKTYSYAYKYDRIGNWVKRTVKEGDRVIVETTRKIEYY